MNLTLFQYLKLIQDSLKYFGMLHARQIINKINLRGHGVGGHKFWRAINQLVEQKQIIRVKFDDGYYYKIKGI